MIIRFLSCVIMLVSKLSLVIGSIRLDIVDPDRLARVILLDWIKSRSYNCDHELIRVGMWMLAKA